jgi:hypothetical protein
MPSIAPRLGLIAEGSNGARFWHRRLLLSPRFSDLVEGNPRSAPSIAVQEELNQRHIAFQCLQAPFIRLLGPEAAGLGWLYDLHPVPLPANNGPVQARSWIGEAWLLEGRSSGSSPAAYAINGKQRHKSYTGNDKA